MDNIDNYPLCTWCEKVYDIFSLDNDFDMHSKCFQKFKEVIISMVRRDYLERLDNVKNGTSTNDRS